MKSQTFSLGQIRQKYFKMSSENFTQLAGKY